ncbi:hypothetical protein Q0M94_02100 [Deinococcus radiomollis]|uniref:hypothetical protein n=1 Tax=Deinococcus radiomollis TaxID=468916 RepID=UPI0038918E35
MKRIVIPTAVAGLVYALTSCGGSTLPSATVDFAGDWNGMLLRPDLDFSDARMDLKIVKSGDSVSGIALFTSNNKKLGNYSGPITGQVSNNLITFAVIIDADSTTTSSNPGMVGCKYLFEGTGYKVPVTNPEGQVYNIIPTMELKVTASGSSCSVYANTRQTALLTK